MSNQFPSFLASFHHDDHSDFISPWPPVLGQTVTLRLRGSAQAPVKRVLLRGIWDGADVTREMTRLPQAGLFAQWEISFKLDQPYLNYSFLIQGERFWYLNRRGVTAHFTTEDHDWVLQPDFQIPEWVRSAVVYQIFPDRFFRGRKTGGVETGQLKSGPEGAWTSKAMEWTDRPLEWDEGHCMDFYNGDLDGIRKKIPYLKDLGVTCLYLTPIFTAPSVHKYDCVDYFHVDPFLGGDKALVKLSQALHDQGMKLVLDISINHVGRDHPWVQEAHDNPSSPYREFFYWHEDGWPEGWLGARGLPQLNYNSAALKKLMYQGKSSVLRKYLKAPFSIDGWRFDVGPNTGRRGLDQMGNQIFREVRQAVKAENPQAWIFGEHWFDSISYHLGDQWDGAMNYAGSTRPIRDFLGELDTCTYAHFYGAVHPAISGRDVKELILQHWARLPAPAAAAQVNLLGSHDIHRIQTFSPVYHWSTYRGAVMTLFLLPGTPMIYYGDEVGLGGTATSIEGARWPMEWNPKKWNEDFRTLWGTLARLRSQDPVLALGGLRFLYADDTTLVLARVLGRRAYLGTLNRCEHSKVVDLEADLLGILKGKEIFSGQRAVSGHGIFQLRLDPRENQFWELDLQAPLGENS